MIQRFFFDRVNAESAGLAVSRQNDAVVLPFANKAEPLLAFVKLAGAGAKVALDAVVFKGMPILGINYARINYARINHARINHVRINHVRINYARADEWMWGLA